MVYLLPWLPGGYLFRYGGYPVATGTGYGAVTLQAKITKQLVDKSWPQEKAIWIWDTEVKGFGLRVFPSGRKSYVVEYRPGQGGRRAPKRRYTIGPHGSPWTPETARKKAVEVLADVTKGGDPSLDRRTARHPSQETLEYFVETFIERYAKLTQKSWQETERALKRELLPGLAKRKLTEITKRDIALVIDRIAAHAPTMANRTFAYVRRFFNWCVEQGFMDVSPTVGLKAPSANKERDRILSDRELLAVLQSLEKVGPLWSAAYKILILTAQRKNEVLGMAWSELDFDDMLWKIPGDRTKNGRSHEVPITSSLVEIISNIPQIEGSKYVFSNTGKAPMADQSRIKREIDEEIAKGRNIASSLDADLNRMPHWTVHDLRRTATTGMARLGIQPHVADALLNHKSGTVSGVAAVYNRYAYLDERRKALETWIEHVEKLERSGLC